MFLGFLPGIKWCVLSGSAPCGHGLPVVSRDRALGEGAVIWPRPRRGRAFGRRCKAEATESAPKAIGTSSPRSRISRRLGSRLVIPAGCIQVRPQPVVVAGRFVLEHLAGLLPVNRQLIFVRFWLARRFPALVSRCKFLRSGIRRLPRQLPRVQAPCDFRLLEPASVFLGCSAR
jgi:hypothetical protein